MQFFSPPNKSPIIPGVPWIFLAGSIEMGKAKDWQTEVIEKLEPYEGIILNPRRADWDATWEQSISNPNFKEQVQWEWWYLQMANYKFFHFEPDTLSPITFGEFTRHYDSENVIVSCPKGWWRRGNVEILSDLAGIPVHDSLEEATDALIKKLSS